MIGIKKISSKAAHARLQQGGLNWILFKGDDFDSGLFEEWSGTAPTPAEYQAVLDSLADMGDDDAIQIEANADA
jgi:hypothetical protein